MSTFRVALTNCVCQCFIIHSNVYVQTSTDKPYLYSIRTDKQVCPCHPYSLVKDSFHQQPKQHLFPLHTNLHLTTSILVD